MKTITGHILRDFLKGRIYKGALNVPSAQVIKVPEELIGFKFVDPELGAISVQNVDQCPYTPGEIKDFMWKKFYNRAIVPRILGLGKGVACPARVHLVDQEIDMMINSSASQVFTLAESQELACVCLNCIWRLDPLYDPFIVDGAEWFKAAASIANNVGLLDGERATIFRDYQHQWIYHVLQCEGQKFGKPYIFYGGMQYNARAFRKGKFAVKYIQRMINCIGTTPEYYVGFLGTFGKFKKHVAVYPDVDLLATAPYSEMNLHLGNEENAFSPVIDEFGLTLVGSRHK